MSRLLKGLSPAVRAAVADRSFRTGEVAAVDAAPYIVDDLGLGRGDGDWCHSSCNVVCCGRLPERGTAARHVR